MPRLPTQLYRSAASKDWEALFELEEQLEQEQQAPRRDTHFVREEAYERRRDTHAKRVRSRSASGRTFIDP